MRIAVSGASGFIGRHLVPYLAARDHQPVPLGRADFGAGLGGRIAGCDAFIHLAGLAHQPGADAAAQEAANVALAVAAAAAAVDAGVRRFVFVSSVNVVAGNAGMLSPTSPVMPLSPYGAAKARAEAVLGSVTGLERVIVRPPLVYGAGAKGNLARLVRLARLPLLPFGGVRNRRSLVAVTSLCSALLFCCTAPAGAVAGQTFHAADSEPLSLREILIAIREGLGRGGGLVSVPVAPMRLALRLVGQGQLAAQLFDDLLVDNRSLIAAGWRPAPDARDDLLAMGRAAASPQGMPRV